MKIISLSQYNEYYEKLNTEQVDFYNRSTNIKCEKCNGIYHYVDSRFTLTSYPPKKSIICNICKDKQYIPV